jgi:hypothetical protein
VNSANDHLELVSLNDAQSHQVYWDVPVTGPQCVPNLREVSCKTIICLI